MRMRTAAIRTIRGMSIVRVMSTTTMPTTLTTRSRSFLLRARRKARKRRAYRFDSYNDGFLPVSAIDGENNSALYTPESPADETAEIAKAERGHFSSIYDDPDLFDDLFYEMLKKRKGVAWKPQVRGFCANGAKAIYDLATTPYAPSHASQLPIYYPKRRTVQAIPFKDRIIQGYLNDRYIYPTMTRSFIYGNMASQTGKGTDKARDLLKTYLWNYYTHHGAEGYVLQIDIHQYYQSIPKDKALELFRRKLPPAVFEHVERIINIQCGNSFFAGSQLVQLLGISYLDGIDHYIKEALGIRYYIRYQDDFLLIHNDRAVLQNAQMAIEEKLAGLGLVLNYEKTQIRDLRKPVLFLGFLYSLQNDGKIYMRPNPKRLKEIRRRIRKFPPCWKSYVDYLGKGGCSHRLIKRLYKEAVA